MMKDLVKVKEVMMKTLWKMVWMMKRMMMRKNNNKFNNSNNILYFIIPNFYNKCSIQHNNKLTIIHIFHLYNNFKIYKIILSKQVKIYQDLYSPLKQAQNLIH